MNHLHIYQDIGTSTEVLGSSQIKHISLLFERLQQNIPSAIEAINNNQLSLKCKKIANSNDIIDYFLDCLDFDADPTMATRLQGIYQHIQKLLFWANAKNDIAQLKEAKIIIDNLNQWWTKTTA